MATVPASTPKQREDSVAVRIPKDIARAIRVESAITDETFQDAVARRLRESVRTNPPPRLDEVI